MSALIIQIFFTGRESLGLAGGRGVFSYFVEQGFRESGGYANGLVTFNSLASYVEQAVPSWTDGKVVQIQKPFRRMVGESRGDFVLGRVGGGSVGGRVVNPPVQQLQRQPAPAPQPQRQPQVVNRPTPVTPASSATRKSFEPEMVNIPAGRFMMGCVLGRDDVGTGCFDNEKPAHLVNVSAFMIGKYEVTFDEWDACTAAGFCLVANDQGWGRGRLPVINVSWNDIQKYIRWLNDQTGKQYRLPTEAEWEYAARGGESKNSAFPWGSQISCGSAAYNYTYCGNDKAKPVGSYTAQAFGLHDTVGNVFEWVQDKYSNYSVTGQTSVSASSDAIRVFRGGFWGSTLGSVRSAFRNGSTPDERRKYVGFRLAQGQSQ